jgi:hypothetical protein
MYLLISGATKTVRSLACHPNIGVLLTPNDGNAIPAAGVVWAADNSAFSGFDEARFRRFLDRIARSPARWVAAPDVVADASETLRRWKVWAPVIREHELPPALVLQDGMVLEDVPWDEVAAIFIGGSTRYKLGEEVVRLVAEARRRGLWVHMGRVNTARRILYAASLNCSSVDGSKFSRWSDTHVLPAMQLLERIQRQHRLPLAEVRP